MIAPEGIRDGNFYAEALYTFAGEGVEDLPFRKGDVIEVLDCADANWWRGKILNSTEDGLFPACLVKFTNAPVTHEAMKTTERLAHLSDLLTPSYAKQHSNNDSCSSSGSNNSSSTDIDPNDSNSIESLLLNLANNEMKVQQQKIHAHMPQKPTRMKLIYEDHNSRAENNSVGRNTSLSAKTTVAKQKKPANKNSLSQAGLWTPPPNPDPKPTSTSAVNNRSSSSIDSSSIFSQSIESMREATQRSEESSKNRSSGSMLFGPRGMPSQPGSSSSRSSSRQTTAQPTKSEQSTTRSAYSGASNSSNDAFTTRTSYASLYSLSDYFNSLSSTKRAAHEAAISEARLLMDGIPSPVDNVSMASHAGGAEYLFEDDEEYEEVEKKDDDKDTNKQLHSMISPDSESSVRFMSYASTISSHDQHASNNDSVLSDTSSVGLANDSHTSVGADYVQFHQSWYSSTDSLNLAGGGGLTNATENAIEEEGEYKDVGADADADDSSNAPKATKNKVRLRRMSGTVTASSDFGSVLASVHNEDQSLAESMQKSMSVSSSSPAYPVSTAYPVHSEPPIVATTQKQQQQQQPVYYIPVSRGYTVTPQSGMVPMAVGNGTVNSNGQPHSVAYNQPMTPVVTGGPYQMHNGVYIPVVPMDQQQTYSQNTIMPMSSGQMGYYNNHPMNMTQSSASAGPTVTTIMMGSEPFSDGHTPSHMVRPRSSTTVETPQSIPPVNNLPPVPPPHGLRHSASSSGIQQQMQRNGSGKATPASIPYQQTSRPMSFAGGSTSVPMDRSLPATPMGQREMGGMTPVSANNVGTSSSAPPKNNSGGSQYIMERENMVQTLDPVLTHPMPPGIVPIKFVKQACSVVRYGGQITNPDSVDWSIVDQQVSAIKSLSMKLTPEILASMHLGRPFTTQAERVRAVFIWIASNIQYDSTTAESDDDFEKQEEPAAVLQRRRSRGPGFAYLFDAMIKELDVESHAIRGYLRQPLDDFKGPTLPEANHVWNAVCLDGEFRLVDTACAAKSHPLNEESKLDTWYFLAAPKEFIYTHFPLYANSQFVNPPVSLPVFWMLPYVRPTFFQCKVKPLEPEITSTIELKDDQVATIMLRLRDPTLSAFAELELHDSNGSGRIVARQPLLAQTITYHGNRMVQIKLAARATEARGLVKVYCGTKIPLQPKRPENDAASQNSGTAQKMLGFLQGSREKKTHNIVTTSYNYMKLKGINEEGDIKTVATSKSFPLAFIWPIVHSGRNNAPTLVQPNAGILDELLIREPIDCHLHLGESVNFHLSTLGQTKVFNLQLRSPSGQISKFIYQTRDFSYLLKQTVKERGAWIILYHTDTEGWLPIASYKCS